MGEREQVVSERESRGGRERERGGREREGEREGEGERGGEGASNKGPESLSPSTTAASRRVDGRRHLSGKGKPKQEEKKNSRKCEAGALVQHRERERDNGRRHDCATGQGARWLPGALAGPGRRKGAGPGGRRPRRWRRWSGRETETATLLLFSAFVELPFCFLSLSLHPL